MKPCACEMFGSENPPDVSREEIRRARIVHQCCECLGPIAPGEQYEHVRGKWEGEWLEFDTCLPCTRVRDDHFCAFAYGQLREEFIACHGYDYLTAGAPDEE